MNFQTMFLNTVNSRVPLLQDCDHVSQTAEEFYTVRCQVADMKNIYVSPADLLLQDSEHNEVVYTLKINHKKKTLFPCCRSPWMR